nr:MAG TPA: hypothetical protein [Bacteriophage sp.]
MRGSRLNRRYLPKALWLYDVHGVVGLFYLPREEVVSGSKEKSIK